MRELRGDIIVLALILSVVAHGICGWYARQRVLTRVANVARNERRVPMRVVRSAERPEPVRFETVEDVEADRKEPEAETEGLGRPLSSEAPKDDAKFDVKPELMDSSRVQEVFNPGEESPSQFAAEVLSVANKTDTFVLPAGSITSFEPARLAGGTDAAPESAGSPSAADDLPIPDFGVDLPLPDIGGDELAAKLEREKAVALPSAQTPAFLPAQEVFAEVDEKIVEGEKNAVRDLLNDDSRTLELKKFVNVAVSSMTDGNWTYFKVMVEPRHDLPVVPKDFVVLIDGSGSIGKDRLDSCRKAARQLLRSALNSGDRFNLVIFRNRFEYLFRSWQSCNADSFAAADKWLARQTAHGRTDVFETIRSVLTLPRDPKRPLVAMVVTDGEANVGVSKTADILSKFTKLNDGLISVYMYGVKSSANRELIDVLTHGNRGESYIFDGWRWSAGEGIEGLANRFRDPVVSDIRVVFSATSHAEAYPRLLRNLYRGEVVSLYGRVPAGTKEVSFSLKGLGGAQAYEGFFKSDLTHAVVDPKLPELWRAEQAIDRKVR